MKTIRKILELEIESIAFEGQAIARKDGLVYFVKGAIAGDKVIAEIIKKKRRYVESRVVEVIEASPERIKPECKYFGICGGCSWQHLKYESQLEWKKRHVVDAFERIADILEPPVEATIECENSFRYRNKMEFSFGASRWLTENEISEGIEIDNKDFALGLHVPQRFDKVLDIDSCLLQAQQCDSILNIIREKAQSFELTALNSRNNEGFLRNLILRYSFTGNEIMSVLVTSSPETDADNMFVEWYEHDFINMIPEVTNVIHAVNNTRNPVAVDFMKVVHGNGFIEEKVLNINFKISPFSFFQTNTMQLEKFFTKILDFASIEENDIVWDLYCGTGAISLCASMFAKKVFGFEFAESSVSDARVNAELNKILNTEFFAVDLHSKEINGLFEKIERPDILIIDPPRAGMHKNLVDTVKKIAAKRIVYVSCNPASQARDTALLTDNYNMHKIQPVDMFPHTYHVESIALFEIK